MTFQEVDVTHVYDKKTKAQAPGRCISRCSSEGVIISSTTQRKQISLLLPQTCVIGKMSTDSQRITKHMEDKAQNKPTSEAMVFDRETGELRVKNQSNVSNQDRQVYVKMNKFFNFRMRQVQEERGGD